MLKSWSDFAKNTALFLSPIEDSEVSKNWLATKPEFDKIILKMPVNVEDDDGRYSREDADRSRLEVNSIRDVVERVHGSQDRFSIFFSNSFGISMYNLKKETL